MEKQFIKVKVTEVHEFIAWVPAPDEETAMEMLRAGEDPDIEVATVSRELVSEEQLGRADANDCAQTRAMHHYLDSLRQPQPTPPPAEPVSSTQAADSTAVGTEKADSSATLDEQFKATLDKVDAAIAALHKRHDKGSEDWQGLLRETRREGSSMLDELFTLWNAALAGKHFTPRGNLICQEGIDAYENQLFSRLLELKKLQGECR